MEPPPEWDDEPHRVITRKFLEARAAGLTRVEARLFAESNGDVGELRKLVKNGCPPATIAKIVI